MDQRRRRVKLQRACRAGGTAVAGGSQGGHRAGGGCPSGEEAKARVQAGMVAWVGPGSAARGASLGAAREAVSGRFTSAGGVGGSRGYVRLAGQGGHTVNGMTSLAFLIGGGSS